MNLTLRVREPENERKPKGRIYITIQSNNGGKIHWEGEHNIFDGVDKKRSHLNESGNES